MLLCTWCRFVRLASGDEEKIREGRTSYPSGHAAETTMTFGILTFYLLARLRLFTRQSHVGANSYLIPFSNKRQVSPQHSHATSRLSNSKYSWC
jgi:membrane-associated phospholipid phosphatase